MKHDQVSGWTKHTKEFVFANKFNWQVFKCEGFVLKIFSKPFPFCFAFVSILKWKFIPFKSAYCIQWKWVESMERQVSRVTLIGQIQVNNLISFIDFQPFLSSSQTFSTFYVISRLTQHYIKCHHHVKMIKGQWMLIGWESGKPLNYSF